MFDCKGIFSMSRFNLKKLIQKYIFLFSCQIVFTLSKWLHPKLVNSGDTRFQFHLQPKILRNSREPKGASRSRFSIFACWETAAWKPRRPIANSQSIVGKFAAKFLNWRWYVLQGLESPVLPIGLISSLYHSSDWFDKILSAKVSDLRLSDDQGLINGYIFWNVSRALNCEIQSFSRF